MPVFLKPPGSTDAPTNITQEAIKPSCKDHKVQFFDFGPCGKLGSTFPTILFIFFIAGWALLRWDSNHRAAAAGVAARRRALRGQQGEQEAAWPREQIRYSMSAIYQRRRELRHRELREQRNITTQVVRDISDNQAELNRRLADLQLRLALAVDERAGRTTDSTILQSLDPAHFRGATNGGCLVEGGSDGDGSRQAHPEFEPLPAYAPVDPLLCHLRAPAYTP
ncbi:MAG: hypothetical protein Q9210_006781 [Variospora velana]